jgi:hypothetical protein
MPAGVTIPARTQARALVYDERDVDHGRVRTSPRRMRMIVVPITSSTPGTVTNITDVVDQRRQHGTRAGESTVTVSAPTFGKTIVPERSPSDFDPDAHAGNPNAAAIVLTAAHRHHALASRLRRRRQCPAFPVLPASITAQRHAHSGGRLHGRCHDHVEHAGHGHQHRHADDQCTARVRRR